jgi:hypothetical protein
MERGMARVGDIASVTGKVIRIQWSSEAEDYEAALELDDQLTVRVPERYVRVQTAAKAVWPGENKALRRPDEDK